MKLDYGDVESLKAEIVRLETENAVLRREAGRNRAPLLDITDDETRNFMDLRLQRCASLEIENGKLRHRLLVEEARSRILAADSARRVGQDAWKALVNQAESQAAYGMTTVATADLMLLICATPAAADIPVPQPSGDGHSPQTR